MANKDPILIPYWVANAFKRKQLPLAHCLDYAKVRQVLSPEDLATLLNLQQLRAISFLGNDYYGQLLSSWSKSAGVDLRNELDSTVIPLSHSKELEGRNLFRLSKDYLAEQRYFQDSLNLDHNTNQEVFELNDFERDSYALILHPGFIDEIVQYDTKMKLVKAMLKVSYVHFETPQVSSQSVFATYVGLLNDKVWGRVPA